MAVQFLTSSATQGVYDRLQDVDLRALGTTSQTLSTLVRKKLEERDQKLESLLLSIYTITKQFNTNRIREIDLFCIGQLHRNSECDAAEIAFVAFLASRYPVILFREGWPSMKPVRGFADDETLEKIDAAIDPAHINTLYAIGWDDQELLDSLYQANRQERDQKRHALDKESLQLLQVMRDILPQRWLPSPQEFSEVAGSYKTANERFAAIISIIIDRGWAEAESCSVQELESLAIVSERCTVLHESYCAIKTEYLGKQEIAIETTYPIRTQSQTSSVQQFPQLRSDRGTPHAKGVLIAGTSHLDSDYKKKKENDLFDLTPFYEELWKHKAAIFLPLGVEAARDSAFRASKEKQREIYATERAVALAEHQSKLEAIQAAIESRDHT